MRVSLVVRFQICLIFLFFSCSLFSQTSNIDSHNSYAEKIYLQLDSDVYTTDKTIWFKVVLANATYHNLEMTSNVLYVDLISSEQEIIESKLIKISDGIGSGHFDLDRSYSEGVYKIRAYTEWNKNFGDIFMSEKYIQVFSEREKDNQQKAIGNIRRMDSTAKFNYYKLDIFPELVDKNHKKSLKVFVDIDDKRDTVYINKTAESKYVLDLEIAKASKIAKVKFQTKSGKTYKTQFTPQPDYISLRFFPEGGKLVENLKSKIGFKALNANGKGIYVEGEIFNKAGEVLTSFKSNKLGMGHFTLSDLKSDEVYTARLTTGKTFTLPEVSKHGFVVKISEVKDIIAVGVFTNYNKDEDIILSGSSRGVKYYNASSKLINGTYIYSIPKSIFPEGIVSFKLSDKDNNPIAERLYFNEQKDTRLIIDASLDNQAYEKRGKVKLNITTRLQNDSIVKANTSVVVLEKSRLTDVSRRENILSYFLLNSDLRGTIEFPSLYFEEKKDLDIDDLMLTQGWRNYKYVKSKGNFKYKLEKGLRVSGVVNVKNNKLKNKKIDAMLVTFEEDKTIYTKPIIPPTSFNFHLDDMFGKPVDIAITSATGSKKKDKKDYYFSINRKKGLPINFNFSENEATNDSIVTQNRKQKKVTDNYFERTFGVTELDEVVIDGYRMTPKRKEVFEKYGEPEIVIEGKEIKEKEASYSYGLYSVLLDFFPDKINIVRLEDGTLIANVIGAPTVVIVDGIPVKPLLLPFLQNIIVDEVESFEVIETSKNYTSLYIQANPLARPPYPSFGGIISIYTKRGIGLFGAINNSEGLDIKTIPVFAIEKEFYTPLHDNSDPNSFTVPDLRSTIYWNPRVSDTQRDEDLVSYYHSDDSGDFVVIIESITNDGSIGYITVEYSVQEPED